MQRWSLRFLSLRADAFQEEGQRRVENRGRTHKRRDRLAVHAALILLNLLKSDAKSLSKFPLAQTERLAARS